jgi:hypothetical protein
MLYIFNWELVSLNLIKSLGLELSRNNKRGEWNALTYPGHTVWNVHHETKGGYVGGGQAEASGRMGYST